MTLFETKFNLVATVTGCQFCHSNTGFCPHLAIRRAGWLAYQVSVVFLSPSHRIQGQRRVIS